MSRIDNLNGSEARRQAQRTRTLETQSPLASSAVTRGRVRIASEEGLVVEGSQSVTGTLNVTGTQVVDGSIVINGTLTINGNTTVDGAFTIDGPWTLNGEGDINGNVDVTGDLEVTGPWHLIGNGNINGDVILNGKITATGANAATLDNGELSFSTGGKVAGYTAGATLTNGTASARVGSGAAQLVYGSRVVSCESDGILLTGPTLVNGSFSATSKSFLIPHPTREGRMLRHGSTESPVHGVEYWGDGVLDDSGHATACLPDYFEALTEKTGRAVLVTGRGFSADWSDITDGRFIVSGEPGGRFSWLVKAVRERFDIEPVEA